MVNRLTLVIGFLAVAGIAGCQQDNSRTWHGQIQPDATTPPVAGAQDAAGNPVAQEAPEKQYARPLSRSDAFAILLNSNEFAEECVGYAGSRSLQVEAWQVLLHQPDAAAVFDDLTRRGTPAGQLYGLCGLWLADRSRYAESEKPVLASTASVYVHWGCTGAKRSLKDLVRSSSPNVIEPKPGETRVQLFQRMIDTKADRDISRGGIPVAFRDAVTNPNITANSSSRLRGGGGSE
jgi:hypothetical protein